MKREPARAAAIYDGRDLVAVIEQTAVGWRLLNRRRELIGVYATRQLALDAITESASGAAS
jgi:hypothetical protein